MSSLLRGPLDGLARRWSRWAESRAETEAARRFWDDGAPGEPENHFWGAQPLVRRAINRRVTGDPNRWPMEWFAGKFASQPFARGLSVGCGTGALERDALTKGICRFMEGLDFSSESVAQARGFAESARLSGRLEYRVADVHRLDLPEERYDVVFFHGSLHHVRSVEEVLSRVRCALKPGGILYVDEYMGPSRSEWTPEEWAFARAAFQAVPEEVRNRRELAVPLPLDDPLESIRSSAIRPAIGELFEILEDRPYGGNVLWFVFPCLDMARLREDRSGLLSRLIGLEDHLLEKRWVQSYFRVVVARRPRNEKVALPTP
jgi:SAM-dependent methyltransferase